jgi:hypothetical protein
VNYPGTVKPQRGTVTVDRVAGDVAIVTYDFSFNGQTHTISSQPWIRANGSWQFDAC